MITSTAWQWGLWGGEYNCRKSVPFALNITPFVIAAMSKFSDQKAMPLSVNAVHEHRVSNIFRKSKVVNGTSEPIYMHSDHVDSILIILNSAVA